MAELANYFALKENTEVHLVLYGITREVFYPVSDKIVICKPKFRFNNKLRLVYTLKSLFFLRRTIRKINPDRVLSFGEYWNSFVLLSLFGLGFPVYVSDRSQPDKSLGRFHDNLRRFLYPFAKGIILQTQKAKDIFLLKNKHPNIAVIGNPIRLINDSESPFSREKAVLTVGRLIKTKHQDKLIEMFAKVSSPDWKLILVGYDHLKQENMEKLRMLAKQLTVENRVVFTGKKDNIDSIYTSSSIFAFTSSSEGFPNVIGEAMSAGLPVIAFDCIAGPSDMITNEVNGFLVPLFNYEEFESKLAHLMEDEDLRLKIGTNARNSIKQFSVDRICQAYYDFIFS